MTDAYIDFLEELFPAISPYTAQRAKDAVREFSRYGSKAPFFAEPLDEEFQQGDIFSKVPFVYVDKEGQGQLAVLGGMLLTNSCDIVRNDNLQFAAMTPIDEYSRDGAKQEAVRSNENYEYLGVVPLFRTVLARLQGLGFACMPRGSSSPASA